MRVSDPRPFLFSLVAATLGACTPLYVSPAVNVPLFKYAGELHVAGHLEATTGTTDLNMAFSPMGHLGILGGFSHADWPDTRHEHTYGELAVGTFFPFGTGRFEAFAGAGYGEASGEIFVGDDTDGIFGTGDYTRFFIQTDIGMDLSFLEMGGSMAMAYVTHWHTQAGAEANRRTAREFFIEPCGFIRIGWEEVKFELQTKFIVPSPPNLGVATGVFQISLGIHLAFDLIGDKGRS